MIGNAPFIPETAPFTAEQRAWLNGFLAGLFAQTAAAVPAAQPNGASVRGEPLLVLFGSQTGSAEGLAKRFAKEAEGRGFAPKVLALNDYEKGNLTAGGKAIIITSTWGDGDPPDNATDFWTWLNADAAPRLDKLEYAVLGLGDRNYSDFCGASKKFDARLELLGAKRIVARGECDVDYEEPASSWIAGVWEKLGAAERSAGALARSNGHSRQPILTRPTSPSPYSKANPFPARLLKNVLLNKAGSNKEVRHYEIALDGSGLRYEAGDALGVVPSNCPELVREILAMCAGKPDEIVKLGDKEFSLCDALTDELDITRPSQELLEAVGEAAPQSELAALLLPEKQEELKRWLWGRGVVDVLMLVPAAFEASRLVSLLKKLAPRLYSIASSPKAHPDQVHLTISTVRYQSCGRARKGVASTFLADHAGADGPVKVFAQPSHGFKPPASGDTPMVMVGPGTGIAPFRAFLEERAVAGAKGNNWLFFGDQKRETDFLYEEQLTEWRNSGFLTQLDLAFSRDLAQKVYVQDRMLENAKELWAWLEAGAHFYVCGDASRMAKDVDTALHRIVETVGRNSSDDAKAYVSKMKSDRRYQRDIY